MSGVDGNGMENFSAEYSARFAIERADQGFLQAFPQLRVRPALSKVSALSQPEWRAHLCNTVAELYDGPAISGGPGYAGPRSLMREYITSALADLSNELRFPRQGVPEFTPAGLALLTTAAEKLETLGVTPEHLQAANRASTAALKQLHPDREDQLIMASEWAFHLLQNPG